MKDQNLESLLDQLNNVVDRVGRDCLRRGPTDLDAVCEAIAATASMLIAKLLPELGERQFRIIVQRRLKRLTLPVEKAAEEVQREDQQPYLDFDELDQVRGVPPTITFCNDAGGIEYIPYRKTRRKHRAQGLLVLDEGIADDMKTRQAMAVSNEFLDGLADIYGDLDADELGLLWQRDQRERGQSGAV
jgi:hypothetical protein